MKKLVMCFVLAWCSLLCASFTAAESDSGDAAGPPLRAAIFIQNRAGAELQSQVDVLNDQITTALTERGFSIIDKNMVIAKLRGSRESDAAPGNKAKEPESALALKKTEAGIEDAVTGASALRIVQMLGADYLVVATISSLGVETKSFKGQGTVYGSDNQSTTYNLRLALKVLEGNRGGSIYGDSVTATERVVTGERLSYSSSDILPKLMKSGARRIADNVAERVERIRNVKVKSVPAVEFAVSSNVDGAIVELDGATVGSTPGRFSAAPGLHQLRVTKEWLSTWERTVNINDNQVLNVSLELSDEGARRFADLEALKQELSQTKKDHELELQEREAAIGVAKEQSEAEAYAKKKVADGEQKKREESYEHVEGAPVTDLDK